MKLSPIAGMQGISWATETFVGKASEAISKGEVLECLLTALEPDDDQSVAKANGDAFGIYAVALEDIASGERGLCALSGKVEVLGGASVDAGDRIMPKNDGTMIEYSATGNNNVCCGICVDAMTSGSLSTVLFDGWQLITDQDQTPD